MLPVRHYAHVPNTPFDLSSINEVDKPIPKATQEEIDREARAFLEELQKYSEFPNLMKPDVLMDLHESATFAPSRFTPFQNKVVVRNDPSMFLALKEKLGHETKDEQDADAADERPAGEEENPLNFLHLRPGEITKLYRYPVIFRRVSQQTSKGKVPRMHVVMVVGNRAGLMGIGEGKSEDVPRATRRAMVDAVRSMDFVERYEERTLFTELDHKFASTQVILRPRPVGFGLHVNPNIYHLFKAAGIKDASAKVWGSRNPLMVIRTTMQMLMPGHQPLGMGNGLGRRGKRLDKRIGMRAPDDVERERGRKLVPLRTW